MTERPKPCHYHRDAGTRCTLRDHADNCPNPSACRGCTPCPWPHCAICNRNHLDTDHPLTCTRCVSSIRDDLAEIPALNRMLYAQAVYANGLRSAAAPIPGAHATVLVSPFTFAADLLWSATWELDNPVGKDGQPTDPMPPVGELAPEEDKWRTWLGQSDGPTPATITNVCAYFAGSVDDQDDDGDRGVLHVIAQASLRLSDDGSVARPPDFVAFARTVATVRVQLEHALHDEREPERGIECFECGDRLVRRFRQAKPCDCGPRPVLTHAPHSERRIVQASHLMWDPEIGTGLGTRYESVTHVDRCCVACQREADWDQAHAGHDQGGLVDPDPGVSWECPTCRMTYTPGEYTNAVRRDLLDSTDGDGWTDIKLAADAASTLTGRTIMPDTVWKWVQRGKVPVCCAWTPGRPSGRRLVFWPDVADQATATTNRPTRRAS